jgi:hypothetical protein
MSKQLLDYIATNPDNLTDDAMSALLTEMGF